MNQTTRRIAELSPQQREFVLRKLRENQARTEDRARPEESPLALPTFEADPQNRYEPFPLIDVQQAYVAGRSGHFDLGTSSANVYVEHEIVGPHRTFLSIFRTAFDRLMERHDTLRLVMLPDGRARILKRAPRYRPQVFDLRRKSPEERQAELDALRERLRYEKPPLTRWPLFEFCICRIDDETVLLVGRLDALLVDGISREQLLQDLFSFIRSRNARVLPADLSIRDFSVGFAKLAQTPAFQRARDYWTKRMLSFPPAPGLPLREALGPRTSARFTLHFPDLLEPEAFTRLKERASSYGITPSMVALSAYADALGAWSRRGDFTLAVEGTEYIPHHSGIEQLAGNFNTTRLLEIDAPQGSFLERTKRIQRRWASHSEHRSFSGFQVMRELRRATGAHSRALFPIFFNSVIEYNLATRQERAAQQEQEPPPTAAEDDDQAVRWREIDTTLYMPSILILTTVAERSDGALICKCQAAEEALAPGVMGGVLEAFRRQLENLADRAESWNETNPRVLSSSIYQRRALVNDTRTEIPASTLDALVAAQTEHRPGQVAIVSGGSRLTYAELAERAACLARPLMARRHRCGRLVGVMMEKGSEQAAAFLGVLEASLAFLPLDPDLPRDRLRSILERARVHTVVTRAALVEGLDGLPDLDLLSPGGEILRERQTPAPETADGDGDDQDLAFVTWESGSNRGVMTRHQAFVNTLLDLNRRVGVTADDRALATAPFDSPRALYDLFGLWAAGGTVILPARQDPEHWHDLAGEHQVTTWCTTPAWLDALVSRAESLASHQLASLRRVLLSGDRLPSGLAERLAGRAGEVGIFLVGGADESSGISTLHSVDGTDSPTGAVWGRPLANQTVHVLDADLEPRPDWVEGEVFIGGAGLSPGYRCDEAATRARFTTCPRSGERLFCTGLAGRFLPSGDLELLGPPERSVIDVRGYPVEPNRVEEALVRQPAVRAAAVVAANGNGHGHAGSLSAYWVGNGAAAANGFDLRGDLSRQLPASHLPDALVRLESLPLDRHGRIDRKRLEAQTARRETEAGPRPDPEPVKPRDDLERQLAAIWEDVLEQSSIGVTDDFFERGGDSFKTVLLLRRIEESFAQSVQVSAFLREATVEHLARQIRRAIERQAAEKRAQAAARRSRKSMKSFILVWIGQVVSLFGSAMGSFALGIWVFAQTDSVTDFTLVAFFASLPRLLISPFAGALVDRWDRRRTMMVSDFVAGLCTLTIALLHFTGHLQLWHVYAIVTTIMMSNAFQGPAFTASVTLMVPRKHLARASGMRQLGSAASEIAAPFLAGGLFAAIGLQGMMAIDFSTFLFAVFMLFLVKIPRPERSEAARAGEGSLWKETLAGWRFIVERHGLLALAGVFTILNVALGMVTVLLTPLVLSFADPVALGTVMSVGGLGALAGALLVSFLGVPRYRVPTILAVAALQGVLLMIGGMRESVTLITVIGFLFLMMSPISGSSARVIWQTKVPTDMQGRVFALTGTIAGLTLPIAYMGAGPLVDHLLQPLMEPDGALAGSLGSVIGVGPGRGVGLLLILLGLFMNAAALLFFFYPRLRHVEREVPDAIDDESQTV